MLQNPPCFPFTNKYECLMQFSTQNKIIEHMMTLLLDVGPMRPPQVPHSRGVCVVYEFVKFTTIPGVDSELGLRANISGASD